MHFNIRHSTGVLLFQFSKLISNLGDIGVTTLQVSKVRSKNAGKISSIQVQPLSLHTYNNPPALKCTLRAAVVVIISDTYSGFCYTLFSHSRHAQHIRVQRNSLTYSLKKRSKIK